MGCALLLLGSGSFTPAIASLSLDLPVASFYCVVLIKGGALWQGASCHVRAIAVNAMAILYNEFESFCLVSGELFIRYSLINVSCVRKTRRSGMTVLFSAPLGDAGTSCTV